MNSSILLTTFVSVSGVFTFWCSLKNYDWFFEFPGPSRIFIRLIGRKNARVIYLLLGLGLSGWGAARIVNPPPKIPTEFIYELASPQGIDLTDPDEAALILGRLPHWIKGLELDQTGWSSFWVFLNPKAPFFSEAVASTGAGPDFHEGFVFRSKSYRGKTLEGRIIYFDSNLVSCDNVMFSDHPLDSASFAIIICTPEASKQNGFGESLAVFYCRAGSDLYRKLIR